MGRVLKARINEWAQKKSREDWNRIIRNQPWTLLELSAPFSGLICSPLVMVSSACRKQLCHQNAGREIGIKSIFRAVSTNVRMYVLISRLRVNECGKITVIRSRIWHVPLLKHHTYVTRLRDERKKFNKYSRQLYQNMKYIWNRFEFKTLINALIETYRKLAY